MSIIAFRPNSSVSAHVNPSIQRLQKLRRCNDKGSGSSLPPFASSLAAIAVLTAAKLRRSLGHTFHTGGQVGKVTGPESSYALEKPMVRTGRRC